MRREARPSDPSAPAPFVSYLRDIAPLRGAAGDSGALPPLCLPFSPVSLRVDG